MSELIEALIPIMRPHGLTPVRQVGRNYGFGIGILVRHDDGREVAFIAHRDEAAPKIFEQSIQRWDGGSHVTVYAGTKYRQLVDRLRNGN